MHRYAHDPCWWPGDLLLIDILVNANARETRVALLENNVLVELFIERQQTQSIVGNIYKGRVSKILPGMQAAFVDIGLAKAGFLYVADISTGSPPARRQRSDTPLAATYGQLYAGSATICAASGVHS